MSKISKYYNTNHTVTYYDDHYLFSQNLASETSVFYITFFDWDNLSKNEKSIFINKPFSSFLTVFSDSMEIIDKNNDIYQWNEQSLKKIIAIITKNKTDIKAKSYLLATTSDLHALAFEYNQNYYIWRYGDPKEDILDLGSDIDDLLKNIGL